MVIYARYRETESKVDIQIHSAFVKSRFPTFKFGVVYGI